MATRGTLINRSKTKFLSVKTQVFNIDNGAGTTVDDQTIYAVDDLFIKDAYIVYTEATDTAGAASANVKIGTTAGGAEIVAATNLGVAKAIGSVTTMTLTSAEYFVPAGTTVRVRHTGVAVTEVGQYFVQIRYYYK